MKEKELIGKILSKAVSMRTNSSTGFGAIQMALWFVGEMEKSSSGGFKTEYRYIRNELLEARELTLKRYKAQKDKVVELETELDMMIAIDNVDKMMDNLKKREENKIF